MKTVLFHPEKDHTAIQEAAAIIKHGGLLGIPTETVYGLGADGLNEQAVRKIFEAKGRPQDNPLILHVSETKEIENFCHSIPKSIPRSTITAHRKYQPRFPPCIL